MYSVISVSSSISNSCSAPDMMESRIFWAPWMSVLLSSGEFRASSAARRARFSPSVMLLPITAAPDCFMVVFTSSKSTFTSLVTVIISAIDLAAVVSTVSALAKAALIVRLP